MTRFRWLSLIASAGLLCVAPVPLEFLPDAVANDEPTPCPCEAGAPLLSHLSLASNVTELGLRSLQGSGRLFDRNLEDRLYQLQFNTETAVPEPCLKLLGLKRTPRVRMTIQTGQTMAKFSNFGSTTSRADSLDSNYMALFRGSMQEDCMHETGLDHEQIGISGGLIVPFSEGAKRLMPAWSACMQPKVEKRNAEVSRMFKEKDWDGLYAIGQRKFSPTFKKSDFAILKLYHEMIQESSSEAEMLQKVEVATKSWATEDKIALTLWYGRRLLLGYDDKRKDALDGRSSGIVSGDELLKNAKNNINKGFFLPYLEKDFFTIGYSGVCRDIAVAEAKLLKAMGLQSYVLAYMTTSGSGHAQVLAIDPKNSNQIYRINYASRSDDTGGSSAALYSKMGSDTGLGYYLFTAEGAPAGFIPGGTTKVLSQMAGGTPQSIGGDPLERSTAKILAAQVPLGLAESLQIGAAQDEVGNRYALGGYTLRYNDPLKSDDFLGVTLGVQNRPNELYGGSKKVPDYNVGLGYFLINKKLTAPALLTGDGTEFRFSTTLLADTAVGKRFQVGEVPGQSAMDKEREDKIESFNQAIEQSGLILWASGHVKFGAEATKKFEKARISGSAEAQVSPITADVREIRPALTLDYWSLSTEGSYRLPTEDQLLLAARLTLVNDVLGARGRAEGSVTGEDLSAGLMVEGALDDKTPRLKDASQRRLVGNVLWQHSTDPDGGGKVSISASPYVAFQEGGTQGFPEDQNRDVLYTTMIRGKPAGEPIPAKPIWGGDLRLSVDY